jgi:hypothetical protein
VWEVPHAHHGGIDKWSVQGYDPIRKLIDEAQSKQAASMDGSAMDQQGAFTMRKTYTASNAREVRCSAALHVLSQCLYLLP